MYARARAARALRCWQLFCARSNHFASHGAYLRGCRCRSPWKDGYNVKSSGSQIDGLPQRAPRRLLAFLHVEQVWPEQLYVLYESQVRSCWSFFMSMQHTEGLRTLKQSAVNPVASPTT